MNNLINFIKVIFGIPLSADEVASILDKRAAANPERLAWRTSVVDLMKLTNMDSSMANRKMLALQYGWSGETGSAEMNQFLHDKLLNELRGTLRGTLRRQSYGS